MKIITVEFKNESIEVIDNFVSVNKICQNLGIDKSRQYQKIQADPTYKSELREIEINGIIQKVLCIPYNKINGWLFSISVNRVKPEVKQNLIEYKNECFEVLYRHFNQQPSCSELPNNSATKELQEIILKQNSLIAATTNTISQEQRKHKNLAKLYESTLNENETLKQKMKQQLSLIVSQVGKEILTRFEESLDVTSRSLELQQLKK